MFAEITIVVKNDKGVEISSPTDETFTIYEPKDLDDLNAHISRVMGSIAVGERLATKTA